MIANNEDVILRGTKLKLAQVAWWVAFILFSALFVFGVWGQYIELGNEFFNPLNLLSDSTSLLGIIIGTIFYWKRPNHWMVFVISMELLISASDPVYFWYYVFNSGWGGLASGNISLSALKMARYLTVPEYILLFTFLLYAILIFPKGRWISPRVKWFFIANVLLFAIDAGLIIARRWSFDLSTPLIIIALGLQIIHYRKIPDPVQRQQIKWILVTFSLWGLVELIWFIFYSMSAVVSANLLQIVDISTSWLDEILYVALLVALILAVVRYRLWDIDNFINRALIYSALTGLLGLIGILSTAILNFIIKQTVGEDSSIWAVVISALPVAAAFNPLRDWLQKFVDRFFKPEEFKFTFIEFTPDVREKLSTEEIISTLSTQVRKQLRLNYAEVYLYNESGQFQSSASDSMPGRTGQLFFTEKQLARLQSGNLIVEEGEKPYSMVIPLVVPRAQIPDFLGVIVLGQRLNGKGYSTQVLSSLNKLGADAGEAIYLSQLNERSKMKTTG